MNATATEQETRRRAPVLVIGVGSELRTDDAAGRRIAEAVGAKHLPLVEVRSIHQLTPEFASTFSNRRLVVVVDASVEVAEPTVRVVDASESVGAMSHHLDVASLVALAGLFADPPKRVVTVAVPAHDLRLGTDLSEETSKWLEPATTQVAALCQEALTEP